jgi:tRNA1Val (adenine37-N6)-methyltransferase
MEEIAANETCDSILGGKIRVIQPKRGYRFSLDAILLARFARVRAGSRVLELGAGAGVITLAIAALASPREAIAVEIQPEMAAMIRRSAALNRLECVTVLEADVRARHIAGIGENRFDLVVANPPYRARQSGRESPDHGRRIARSESGASLADFIAAAARYAREHGSAAFVFAADRAAELISAMRAKRLEPKRIRFVHPYAHRRANTVLIEARKGGGIELEVEPPLIVHSAPGVYTAEAHAILGIG